MPLLGAFLVVAGLIVLIARGWSSLAVAESAADQVEVVAKVYPCQVGEVDAVSAMLRQRYQDNERVRVVADRAGGRVVVRAPVLIHEEIFQRGLRWQASHSPSIIPTTQPASDDSRSESNPPSSVPLHRISYSTLKASLGNLMGDRMSAAPANSPGAEQLRLALSEGSVVELHFDEATRAVSLQGPGSAIQSTARLIQTLDAPVGNERATTRIMSVQQARPLSMRRAVDAIEGGLQGDSLAVAQVPPGAPPSGTVRGPGIAPADESVAVPPAGKDTGLIGPVQIEMLEGLDVMVVKGHRQDVDRVMEIIRQIDQLSAVTEPVIRVYRLVHVECEALAELISPLYEKIYQPRQSAVTITPLVKPNAVLLIGRAESVETMVKLIGQLDHPVAPDTQFRVFALRHASATTAQMTIEQFFTDTEGEPRAGLGSRVHAVADFRSNALIVQAGPRDMAEIAELIAKLDVENGEAVKDVRVFRLRNALAEDLAEVLLEAITVQQSGRGTTGGQFGQFGGVASRSGGRTTTGGIGYGSQQELDQKSAALRFITVDAEGQRLLRSGILTDVRISADVRANALVVAAPADSMPLLAALIDRLDQLPAAEAQVKVFTILNGDAEALLEMLESLFGTETTANEAASVLSGAVQNESSLVPLRFAVDLRTNSIIVSGASGDLTVVEAILLRLDDSEVRSRKTCVFKLKNTPAADVATAINDFLESEREVDQIAPGLVSPFEQIEREVVVVPEEVTNSLIVSATPRYYDEIKAIIDELDAQPPMVVIQVLIAEVVLSDAEELGVELGLQDSVLFDRGLLLGDGSLAPGFNWNNEALGNSGSASSLSGSGDVGTQGLSSFGLGRTSAELGYGGLVLSASSGNVSVLMRALKQCGRLDVLARPQIMTLDNQAAQVQVGQNVSRVTGTIVNSNVQNTTVEDTSTGLILLVTPRINDDGMVVMNISATNSELGAESEGTPVSVSVTGEVLRSPPINIITAETTIAALSGQTIVLGGLITKERDMVERKVPLLGDIPILGWLARYDSEQIRRSELLIIMTPHVVRTREDAERIKQIEAARMHWCLGDVVKLTDDPGLMGGPSQFGGPAIAVVYPDLDPTGENAAMPAGAAPNGGLPTGALPPEPPPASKPKVAPTQTMPTPAARREPSRLPVEGVSPAGQPTTPAAPQGSQIRVHQPDAAHYRPATPGGAYPVAPAVHYGQPAGNRSAWSPPQYSASPGYLPAVSGDYGQARQTAYQAGGYAHADAPPPPVGAGQVRPQNAYYPSAQQADAPSEQGTTPWQLNPVRTVDVHGGGLR